MFLAFTTHLQYSYTHCRGCLGATENAELDNDGPSKSRGWKMPVWKMMDPKMQDKTFSTF